MYKIALPKTSLYANLLDAASLYANLLDAGAPFAESCFQNEENESKWPVILHALITGLSYFRYKHGSCDLPSLQYVIQSQERPKNIDEGLAKAQSPFVETPGKLHPPHVPSMVPDWLLPI